VSGRRNDCLACMDCLCAASGRCEALHGVP
jgi:hypothetical protein